MTITLSDNLNQTSTGLNTGTFEAKIEGATAPAGIGFGQFMSDMLQMQTENPAVTSQVHTGLAEQQGQEIADDLGLEVPPIGLDTPAWSLQAIHLGPHLNVITPATMAPDTQSLEAFARAQGLDEQAVNWLFGGIADKAAIAPGMAPSAGDTLAAGNPVSSLGSLNFSQASEAVAALQPGTPTETNTAAASTMPARGSGSATTGLAVNAPLGTQVLGAMGDDPGQTMGAESRTTSALPGSNPGGPPSNWAIANDPGQAMEAGNRPSPDPTKGLPGSALAGVQALWAMAENPGQTRKTSASTGTTTEEALPIQMLRMPPPAAVWMQRGVMNSLLQDKASAQKEATISLSELDLGADWGGEALEQLLAGEGSAHGHSSTGTHGTAYANFAARWDAHAQSRTDPSNANGAAPDLPDANARSENIQNLADKMGQAVGQRILSEMEKGQWHLKLQLRPATLGHIEVEMRLRSGEFDAVFTAPNAATRELLQDGMAKLRETLSQMGMDVANIHVGGGQTGQSGGDSTPGFSKGTPAQNPASQQESTAEIPRAPRVKDPKDGLDVLV